MNFILISHYPAEHEAHKLVNEYKNNGLEVSQIDYSNFRTAQAYRTKMLSDLIIANSKYTSNPKKYVDDIEYTSGTEVLNCDNK